MSEEGKRKRSFEDKAIHDLYKKGYSLSEISKMLFISISTLSKIFKKDEKLALLKKAREEENQAGSLFYKNKARIKEMMREGMTFEQMSEVLKCKRSTLYYWVCKKDILN